MTESNVEIVRRLFHAQALGDLDTIQELYAPDIEWEDVSGLWGDWGVRRGRKDIQDAFATWFEAFEDVTFRGEHFSEIDEHVVVTTRISGRGRGSGLAIDQPITLVWAVDGGQVTRVWGFRERREALDALGLAE